MLYRVWRELSRSPSAYRVVLGIGVRVACADCGSDLGPYCAAWARNTSQPHSGGAVFIIPFAKMLSGMARQTPQQKKASRPQPPPAPKKGKPKECVAVW